MSCNEYRFLFSRDKYRISWLVFEGCPDTGYYNGSDCCPGVNCVNCDLEAGACLECKPGYQGRRCEQGNVSKKNIDASLFILVFEKKMLWQLMDYIYFLIYILFSIIFNCDFVIYCFSSWLLLSN